MREGFTTGHQPTAKPWLLTCASWQTGFYIQETVQPGFPGALQSLGTTDTNTFGTCQIYPPILQISQKVPLLPTFHLWWAFLFCKTILLMLDLLLLCLVHPSLPLLLLDLANSSFKHHLRDAFLEHPCPNSGRAPLVVPLFTLVVPLIPYLLLS